MKKKVSNSKFINKTKLIFAMSAIVFTLVLVSFMGFWLICILLYKIPFIDIEKLPQHTNIYILLALSLCIGIILSMIFRKYILLPLHDSYQALRKISDGNFDVHINEEGIRTVRKITKSVNITARKLNNFESMRSDFINNFSHEFRTPITAISGFARLLKKADVSEQDKDEYLDIIISESERLAHLSSNILTLTRLNNQSILTGIRSFNVTEQIRRTVILFENKWCEKNISVSLNGEEYNISANEELLSQLWINLLDNAIKFSPEGTEIRIAVTQNGDSLSFTFADEGKGMDEETARHAFDRFYQGDISRKSSGSGIGLALAKRICDLHSGEIKIKSTGKHGTIFEVILPSDKD